MLLQGTYTPFNGTEATHCTTKQKPKLFHSYDHENAVWLRVFTPSYPMARCTAAAHMQAPGPACKNTL